jgi:hypothetical protein
MDNVRRLPAEWLPVSIAPSGKDLQLCVIERGNVHSLAFPCRKDGSQWVDASTEEPVDVQPTHWRLWTDDR